MGFYVGVQISKKGKIILKEWEEKNNEVYTRYSGLYTKSYLFFVYNKLQQYLMNILLIDDKIKIFNK